VAKEVVHAINPDTRKGKTFFCWSLPTIFRLLEDREWTWYNRPALFSFGVGFLRNSSISSTITPGFAFWELRDYCVFPGIAWGKQVS
jgi:hypothetical protein